MIQPHRSTGPGPAATAPLLMRLKAVAAACDTSINTIRYWVRVGILPMVRIGRNVYVTRADLDRLIDEGRQQCVGVGPDENVT